MAIAALIKPLRRRWFLVSLVVLIVVGIAAGASFPQRLTDLVAGGIRPTEFTAVILVLMSFSLDGSQIRKALRAPAPVLWASLVNMGLLPLLAWLAMGWQPIADFQYGVLIAGCVPCTLAAVSVWTRKAGGNDAVSLLVTLLTNGLCFLVTPFWLNLVSRGEPISLDGSTMVLELGVFVMVPTLLGQLARLNGTLRQFADRRKHAMGIGAQFLILAVILRTALKAGVQVDQFGRELSAGALFVAWGTCVALHFAGLIAGSFGAKRLGLSPGDRIAVAFASSQKTLPIGVLLATNEKIFGNPDLLGPGRGVPFVVFPMLIYHASQLFIDTIVAERFVAATAVAQSAGVSCSAQHTGTTTVTPPDGS